MKYLLVFGLGLRGYSRIAFRLLGMGGGKL